MISINLYITGVLVNNKEEARLVINSMVSTYDGKFSEPNYTIENNIHISLIEANGPAVLFFDEYGIDSIGIAHYSIYIKEYISCFDFFNMDNLLSPYDFL